MKHLMTQDYLGRTWYWNNTYVVFSGGHWSRSKENATLLSDSEAQQIRSQLAELPLAKPVDEYIITEA